MGTPMSDLHNRLRDSGHDVDLMTKEALQHEVRRLRLTLDAAFAAANERTVIVERERVVLQVKLQEAEQREAAAVEAAREECARILDAHPCPYRCTVIGNSARKMRKLNVTGALDRALTQARQDGYAQAHAGLVTFVEECLSGRVEPESPIMQLLDRALTEERRKLLTNFVKQVSATGRIVIDQGLASHVWRQPRRSRQGSAMKRKPKLPEGCLLICWSLEGEDGQMRPPVCPRCFKRAEVGLDMIGRPCYFHKREIGPRRRKP
jgi:hypothetical protein